jgi:hypothetical protein
LSCMSAMFSFWLPKTRCAGLTHSLLSQVCITTQPWCPGPSLGMGPLASIQLTLCANTAEPVGEVGLPNKFPLMSPYPVFSFVPTQRQHSLGPRLSTRPQKRSWISPKRERRIESPATARNPRQC